MSRINGEKSRANLHKRKRTLQREKARIGRAASAVNTVAAPAAPAAKKSSKRASE